MRQHAKQRAERADEAAVKPRDPQIQKQRGEKDGGDGPCGDVKPGRRRDPVKSGQNHEIHRAMNERNRIEQTGL